MLSPQSQRIREWLFQNVKNAPPAQSVEEARARLEIMGSRVKLPAEITVEPVQAEHVCGEWIRFGKLNPEKTILYFHGGGYTMGSARSARGLASMLAAACRCPVFTVDYRLAPEHPFPAALEDAVSAWHWLNSQGIQPENIIFLGDSAGGGLALASLLALRDAHKQVPAAAVLICPWTDLADTVDSRVSKAACDPWFNPDSIENQAAQFYAGGNDLKNPLVSPLYARLHDLPPMLIQAASEDTLLDDAIQLYDNAQRDGTDIELEVFEGMWHVFHNFAAVIPEGREAIRKIADFVQQKLRIMV